jgi:hypothetical protein
MATLKLDLLTEVTEWIKLEAMRETRFVTLFPDREVA